MLPFQIGQNGTGTKVLALGCHSDDLEIGCGGTILKLIEQGAIAEVHWIVLSGNGERAQEARRSAEAMLDGAPANQVIVRDFPDGFFPYEGQRIKDFFEQMKAEVSPDVVFTHQRADLHQDHRLCCELTWNTFRDHLILEYEVPKYDGDFGTPNVYVPLDEEQARRKVELLLDSFPSQAGKRWFTEDLFMALMRLRGMECNSPSGLAEAFYGRKLSL
jgi:LmbE family N-acetylglucosaminyl deacetylase